MEQKLAAYRYLIHRMHSLPFNAENNHKELNTIMYSAKTNGFPYSIIPELSTQLKKYLYHLHTVIHLPTTANKSSSLTTTQ
jgi:hypothetical protein